MVDKKEKSNIEQLRENYTLLKKKYDLPEFNFINDNFEIESIESDSEIILKLIRKHITERIFSILRSLEMFLNPQNAPLFIFNIIKSFGESDKELIDNLYQKIASYEIDVFGLEFEYSERAEADFINKFSKDWDNISADLRKIHASMKNNFKNNTKKQDKSYFG